VANFRLAASIPLYVGLVFGFARDRWNLFGRKDRGMLIVFGLICAAVYAGFAVAPPNYLFLMLAILASSVAWSFTRAAEQGLASMAGQQLAMTGWMSVVWSVCASIPYLAAYGAGGLLSEFLEGQNAAAAARILFLVGAAVMGLVALYGVWKPRGVYAHLKTEQSEARPLQDLGRLVRHWPVYPALGVYFLWSFAPAPARPSSTTSRTPCTPPTRSGARGTPSSRRPSSRPICCTASSAGGSRRGPCCSSAP
jgi:MFS family permease